VLISKRLNPGHRTSPLTSPKSEYTLSVDNATATLDAEGMEDENDDGDEGEAGDEDDERAADGAGDDDAADGDDDKFDT